MKLCNRILFFFLWWNYKGNALKIENILMMKLKVGSTHKCTLKCLNLEQFYIYFTYFLYFLSNFFNCYLHIRINNVRRGDREGQNNKRIPLFKKHFSSWKITINLNNFCHMRSITHIPNLKSIEINYKFVSVKNRLDAVIKIYNLMGPLVMSLI